MITILASAPHAHLGSEERRRHRLGDDDRDAAVVSRHDSDLREGLHRRQLARDVAAARVNAVLERAGLALGRDVAGAGVDAILERDGLGGDADGVAAARVDNGRVVRQRRLSATERERVVLQGRRSVACVAAVRVCIPPPSATAN